MIKPKKEPPFISIVIPTRDRPNLLKICLEALANQDFRDFEVIVCDNFINSPCLTEMTPYQDDTRFKYFTPNTPLAMCDNWDFAISKATGNYVAIISEKYLLRADALSTLFRIAEDYPAELISWWHETYAVTEANSPTLGGKYVPKFKPKSAHYFDPMKILQMRMSFAHRPYSRNLGTIENLGKIYSGCFHRSLLEKIQAVYGRIFPLTSPDTTSMVAGLSLAKSCVDLGQPLMMVCSAMELSNGYQCITDTTKNKEYFDQLGCNVESELSATMPFKNILAGSNVYIAHDYAYIQSKTTNPNFKKLKINEVNLLIRIKEDLNKIQIWADENEKTKTKNSWQFYVNKYSDAKKQYIFKTLKNESTASPSLQEIFFAGGTRIDDYKFALSAQERAKMNWLEGKVFRINDKYLHYDNVISALNYFSDYYKESARLLNL